MRGIDEGHGEGHGEEEHGEEIGAMGDPVLSHEGHQPGSDTGDSLHVPHHDSMHSHMRTPSPLHASAHELPSFGSATGSSDMLTPEEAAEEVHPLHYAAATGDKRGLQQLLDAAGGGRAAVHERDLYGRTPLVYAVVSDRMACAELLIKRGTEVDMADQVGGDQPAVITC